MMRLAVRAGVGLALASGVRVAGAVIESDLCVYGATSGGVVAAVQGARLGKSVVLIAQNDHVGGMSSGGLGVTDRGVAGSIGGLAREFYLRVGQHYGSNGPVYFFEPHVAEAVFWRMLAEAGVPVYTNQQLASVTMAGLRLTELVTDKGLRFRAKAFLDTTYEGDLMAAAGVSFTVGREGTNVYGESLAGVRPATASYDYDPYLVPGDPSSGLLPLLQPDTGPSPGQGDHRVQAYNFRLCLTQNPTNRLPIAPPANYSEQQYELVARYIEARLARDGAVSLGQLIHLQTQIPNGKTDINANGELSTDYVGGSWTYPTNSPAGRAVLWRQHEDYIRGFLHFLATSPRVPANVRAEMQTWGLCRDEFQDTGGWPHQLYVREARRMISDYVMTQANCQSQRFVPDSIGLASYAMDSHSVQRVARDGRVRVEGGFFVPVPQPFGISYRSIVPRAGECENLWVTFALSASHVAFSSCRMEPVFMITSQSAATAAAFAIDDGLAAQQVPYVKLAAQLRADGQVLDWSGGLLTTNGVILDEGEPGVAVTGSWVYGANPGGWAGDYLHDQNSGKGAKAVRYAPNLPFSGVYDVYLWWVEHANRATNVPVDIIHANGTNRVRVNQTINGSRWVWLLRTNFLAGPGSAVVIGNEGTTGYVIADAVRFMPAEPFTVPPPRVQVVGSDPQAGEWGPDQARFTIVREGDLSQPLTVRYSLSGHASNGVDFQALSGQLILSAGVVAAPVLIQPLPDALVEGDETVTLTLQPDAAYTIGPLNQAAARIADRPWDAWRWTRFSPQQLADPQTSGPDADPDSDGVSNLTEYALGLDPLRANRGSNGLPKAEFVHGHFTLTFTRSKAARDVTVQVETSDDLVSWTTGWPALEENVLSDEAGLQTIQVRQGDPAQSKAHSFLRLRVAWARP